MHPTPCQLKLLKHYRENHASPPTIGSVLRRNLLPLVFFVILMAAGIYTALNSWGWLFGTSCFVAGMGYGALSRVVRQLVNAVRLWPMIEQIVDWSKVDSMLGDRSTS